jgi:hypothetical protein
MFNNLSVARRLTSAFAAVIVVFLAVCATALVVASRLTEADDWNTHTHHVLQKAQGMLLGMVNMETGARGFLLAGDDRFLRRASDVPDVGAAQHGRRRRGVPRRASAPRPGGGRYGPGEARRDGVADVEAGARATAAERRVGVDHQVAARQQVGPEDPLDDVAGVGGVGDVEHQHGDVRRGDVPPQRGDRQ